MYIVHMYVRLEAEHWHQPTFLGAYVVGADPLSDIAILQVNSDENVRPASFELGVSFHQA